MLAQPLSFADERENVNQAQWHSVMNGVSSWLVQAELGCQCRQWERRGASHCWVPAIPRFPKSTSFTLLNIFILPLLPQARSSHPLLTRSLGQVSRVLGGKEAHEDCGISMVEELTVTECCSLFCWGPPHA